VMSLCECEVEEESVLVRVGCLFLIPLKRSHKMRTKPRAHMAIAYSHMILVKRLVVLYRGWGGSGCHLQMIATIALLLSPGTIVSCAFLVG